MQNFSKHFVATLGLGLLAATTAHAQLGVNTGANAPTSTLQVAGSVSAAIVTVSGSYTLTGADHTVIYTGSSAAPTFTLPAPSTCKGRIYHLINGSAYATYNDVTLSRPVTLFSGLTTTTLAVQTYYNDVALSDTSIANTATIQSDGTVWWRIGL